MISVSFLSSNKDTLSTIKELENTNTDYIHVDMMDGKFVNNKNYTMGEFTKLLNKCHKKLDVHLMVKDPLKYLDSYAMLNTEYITFHYEAVKDINNVINKIKSLGLKVGIAINPETNINVLNDYLNDIDLILIMSVHPGMGGQEFINTSLDKISALNEIKKNYHYLISVDGGINDSTGKQCIENGVDILVSGSYICKSNDYQEAINNLK